MARKALRDTSQGCPILAKFFDDQNYVNGCLTTSAQQLHFHWAKACVAAAELWYAVHNNRMARTACINKYAAIELRAFRLHYSPGLS